jgi:hypothetical protein
VFDQDFNPKFTKNEVAKVLVDHKCLIQKFGFVKELLNELSFDVFKPFLTA